MRRGWRRISMRGRRRPKLLAASLGRSRKGSADDRDQRQRRGGDIAAGERHRGQKVDVCNDEERAENCCGDAAGQHPGNGLGLEGGARRVGRSKAEIAARSLKHAVEGVERLKRAKSAR